MHYLIYHKSLVAWNPSNKQQPVGVGDMTKILYHDMTNCISQYSDFSSYIKIFNTI